MEHSLILLAVFLVAMLLSVPIALALGFSAMLVITFASSVPPVIVIQNIYTSTDTSP